MCIVLLGIYIVILGLFTFVSRSWMTPPQMRGRYIWFILIRMLLTNLVLLVLTEWDEIRSLDCFVKWRSLSFCKTKIKNKNPEKHIWWKLICLWSYEELLSYLIHVHTREYGVWCMCIEFVFLVVFQTVYCTTPSVVCGCQSVLNKPENWQCCWLVHTCRLGREAPRDEGYCCVFQYVFERMSGAFTHKLWHVREGVLVCLQNTINRSGCVCVWDVSSYVFVRMSVCVCVCIYVCMCRVSDACALNLFS